MTAWSEVPLGDLGTEVRESLTPDGDTHYVHYSVPSFADGDPTVEFGSEIKSNKRVLHPGDILICRINPRINRVWIVGGHDEPIVGSTEWVILRLPEDAMVLPSFLLWYLRSPRFRHLITGSVSGVTGSHTRAKAKDVLGYPVPVPSLDEQHAIVETIERTLSKVDAATSSVLSGQARSTVLRGSALQLMLESAKSLADDLPLDAFWESANYGTSERCEVDGPGLPVLRIPNIRDRAVDFSEIKRVASPEGDVDSAVVTPDDVLIVRTNGSRSLIGRTAVVPTTAEPFACASYLIRIRSATDLVRADFVAAALEAPSTREQIEKLAASSAGQYNLSVAKLRKLSIPVPSLAAQDQLLQELAQRESMVTHADAILGRLTRRSAQLRRSILKAAFEGQLTHDTTDTSVRDFEQVHA